MKLVVLLSLALLEGLDEAAGVIETRLRDKPYVDPPEPPEKP